LRRDDRRLDTRDTNIGVGDIVRAWIRLRAHTAEERALIAGLLGFDYTFKGKERRPRAGKPGPATAAAATAPGTLQSPSQPAEGLDEPASPVVLPLERVSAQTALPTTTPDWLRIDRPLEAERPQHLDAPCATASPDGPIDMARLVETLAGGRPLTELPRERIRSLGRGIELLVDRGDNLMPFTRDVRDLQRQLQLVVGHDRTRIQHFDGCPTLGCGPGARSTWTPRYEPPPAETPIVVITDFGMARGSAARTAASQDTWLNFFRMAQSTRCPVIVFAPYPLSRWPRALSKAVRAIPWDRSTTVSLAHQAVRREGDGG
jgi:hypothetical protein